MPEFSRSNVPPPPKDVIWVARIKPMTREKFTVYSPALWGVWTHWTGKLTQPCYADHQFCHQGHKEETLRWKAYVFGWSFERNRQEFLELTAGACDHWLSQLAPGVSLRGMTIEVYRDKRQKGPLLVQVAPHVKRDCSTLPPDRNPEKSLLRLWKVPDIVQAFNKHAVTGHEEIPGDALSA